MTIILITAAAFNGAVVTNFRSQLTIFLDLFIYNWYLSMPYV